MNFNTLNKPYLIAEIGINHNGDLQTAKKLIDATFACSWDCVKFQKRNPDKAVPESQKQIERITPWGKMPYIDYKKKIEFNIEEYNYINKYCSDKPIDWTTSIWDDDSLDFMEQYDVPFIKIPSALITNTDLIKRAAKTNIPIIISTGMSTIEEIDTAVSILETHASQLAILHCNSSYPADNDSLNLNMIKTLKERYNHVIGYSGHEYGLDSTAIAVSMGAMIIERHITLDRTNWGTDQNCSVEIQGMDKLYKQISKICGYMGDGIKTITPKEQEIKNKLRK